MMFREFELAAIEALLFVAKDPLTVTQLENILDLPRDVISELIDELKLRYSRPDSGIELIEVNNGYRLCTKSEFSNYIEKLYRQPVQGLSHAALEVLAIVAYRQPVTRGEIDFLRGVQSERALATLIEKGLVKEVGRKEGPGRPILYGTTEKFLLHFNLASLDELPPLRFESRENLHSDAAKPTGFNDEAKNDAS